MKNEADLDRKKIQGEFYESLTVAELAEWWRIAAMFGGKWEPAYNYWMSKQGNNGGRT